VYVEDMCMLGLGVEGVGWRLPRRLYVWEEKQVVYIVVLCWITFDERYFVKRIYHVWLSRCMMNMWLSQISFRTKQLL